MPKFAERVSRAKPSKIIEIAMKAKAMKAAGEDVISLSIGVPNFLPGEHVYEAARNALSHDSGQYGTNRGAPGLLEAFAKHLENLGFEGYGPDNFCISVGAKHGLFNLLQVFMDDGDTIAFPTPYWASYMDMIEIAGLEAMLLPCPAEQNYKLTPEQLDEALAKKPRVFLFNNPSNPTGMVYTRDEIAALADVLVKHPDTWIITDDLYNQMIFDGIGYHNFVHCRPELKDRLVMVDSLSKSYGMPGWRVGLMAGPEAVAKACVTMNSNQITNIPEVAEHAAIAALSGPQDVTQGKCKEFAEKRDMIMDVLNGIDGMVCPRPQGAFYVFPDISFVFGKKHGDTVLNNDVDVVKALLDSQGVACVPGSAFGAPNCMRISYTCPTEQLPDAMKRIQSFFAEIQ